MQPPLLGLLPSLTLTNGGAMTLLPWPWTPLWCDQPRPAWPPQGDQFK